MEHLTFLNVLAKDRNVGAIAPTSNFCVRHVCRMVDRTRPVVMVEYGPGTGVFTRHLLKMLHPGSTLIAIELNETFAERLRELNDRRPHQQPRLVIESENAINIQEVLNRHGFASADYVLSGIPFSFLDEEVRQEIVQKTHDALVPGGKFLVYQYSFLMKEMLQETFSKLKIDRVLFNLPPMCLMYAMRDGGSVELETPTELWRKSLRPSFLVNARNRRLPLRKQG